MYLIHWIACVKYVLINKKENMCDLLKSTFNLRSNDYIISRFYPKYNN